MLWTDPQEPVGRGPSKRGVGLGFGPDVTRRWCELNNVTAVIRSHEVRADGYAIEHDGLCITVFSCPNYCDSTGNKVGSGFSAHPYSLPTLFLFSFTWIHETQSREADKRWGQAAYIRMQADGTLSYHQFDAVPHPNVKPMAYSSGFGFSGMM